VAEMVDLKNKYSKQDLLNTINTFSEPPKTLTISGRHLIINQQLNNKQ